MERKTQINLWYVLLAMLAVIWLREAWVTSQQVEPVPYSQFQKLLDEGNVAEITIRGELIHGTLKTPLAGGETKFVTTRVQPELAKELSKYGVKFGATVENTFLRDVLSWVVPALVFFGLWMFLIRKMAERQGGGGGFLSLGTSKAKIYVETDTKATFADVAGVDEAKAELEQVVGLRKLYRRDGR